MPRQTHREIISLLSDCIPIGLSLYTRFLKFVKVAHVGQSGITRSVMQIVRNNPLSSYSRNCNLVEYLFGIDCSNPYVLDLKARWFSKTERLDDQVHGLRELLDARFSKTLDNGLDEDDVEALVYMLAAG